MIWFIISLIIIGAIAGYLARLLVPGPDPMSVPETILLGIVGSFVGGILANLIFHGEIDFEAGGIIGSIVGAVIALLIYRQVKARGSAPATRRR